MTSDNSYAISVLLIEDLASDQKLITYYLSEVKQQTYQIYPASKLSTGLEILATEPIDIVLLDLHLPDSSGLETFAQINEQFPNIPIIIMTGALVEEHLALIALEKGAQDYLEKDNLSSSILRKAIQYALKRKELTNGLENAQRMGKLGFWKLNPLTMEWGSATYLNEMLERDFHHPLKSLAEFLKMVHPEDRATVRECFKEAALHKSSFELIYKTIPLGENQATKFFSLKGKAVLDPFGEVRYLEGTAQDISERLRLEEAIHQKELAQKEAQIRQEFLAKTSHEIRTPLNPILVLADLLLESPLSKENVNHVTNIKYAANTLLALVNDILDLSKIEAGKIEFSQEVFSLNEMFHQLRDLLLPSAEKKALRLYFNFHPGMEPYDLLVGDAVRLAQIIINLNTNAIKFTERGWVINTVKLLKDEGHQVWLEFSIQDTGIGIPKDQLNDIFESFKQVDTLENRRNKGTGLGLTIVRQLVNLQGGRLRVESNFGQGSTFFVEMPFNLAPKGSPHPGREMPQPATTSPPAPSKERDLQGLNILMVEDDPLNQLVTEKLLEKWNARVEIANNGEEGIAMLQKGAYDLILMDVHMPVKNGLEATKEIREQLPLPYSKIPIIALTANTISGSDDECFKVDMNDYVSKPIETENFYRKLVTYVRHASNGEFDLKNPIASGFDEEGKEDVPKENSTLTPMADARYTDLSGLTSMYGGDMFLVKKTVKTIVNKVPEYLADMNNYRGEGNFQKVAEMIHKLKANVVGYMGINEFSEGELDQMIHNIKKQEMPREKIDAFLDKFNRIVNTGIQELKNDLENQDETA